MISISFWDIIPISYRNKTSIGLYTMMFFSFCNDVYKILCEDIYTSPSGGVVYVSNQLGVPSFLYLLVKALRMSESHLSTAHSTSHVDTNWVNPFLVGTLHINVWHQFFWSPC